MVLDTVTQRLALPPSLPDVVLMFFAYSFIGYCLECVVLTIDKRRLVIDRGFAGHLPFCIIYGFGAMAGYALLSPYGNNLLVLFFVGAIAASAFEYLTAVLQIWLFGDFWWDYTEKPLNYKGILCLESTIGWGVAVVILVKLLHRPLAGLVAAIPANLEVLLAVVLLVAYALDFTLSARAAYRQKRQVPQQAEEYLVE